MLEVSNLSAGYGRLQVLRGVSMTVPAGGAVTLLGGNGAGKTTMMKTLCGLLRSASGEVVLEGTPIQRQSSHAIFSRGVALVPQGRELFPSMTVAENLELGGLRRLDRAALAAQMETVFSHFPRLRERARQRAGTLSGGEQQMLATGRALMSKPKLLLLDEPTSGLAPLIVAEIARIIQDLNEAGQTILLVEQNVRMALGVADSVYVIRNGRIVMEGPREDFGDSDEMFKSFMG